MFIDYNNIISKIDEVSVIDSQIVSFVKVTRQQCSNCKIDPINKTSTNIRCKLCGGSGYVNTEVKTSVRVNVDEVSGLETLYEHGGKLEAGQVILVANCKELEDKNYTPTDFLSLTPPVDYYIVNGKKYRCDKYIPGRLHGTLYEIELILTRTEDVDLI